MKIAYGGSHPGLKAAMAFVNQLGSDESFWRAIRDKSNYTHTSVDGGEIEARLRGNATAMAVKVWRPKWYQRVKYWKTVAFVDERFPHTLFYHEKFIGNSIGEMVNTFVHEYIHDVDDDGVFGHGDNNPVGKENSPPYWIGSCAERLYNQQAGRPPTATSSLQLGERGNAADGTAV